MTKSRVFVFVATLTTFLLVACKPSVPSQYIAPDELEEVLYLIIMHSYLKLH